MAQPNPLDCIFTEVLPTEPYNIWFVGNPNKHVMNPDPNYFWKTYCELFFQGKITQVCRYKNTNPLSGFCVDVDVQVPCDSDYQPLDINEDIGIVQDFAIDFQTCLSKTLFYANEAGEAMTPVKVEDLGFVILARSEPKLSEVAEDGDQLYVRYGFHVYYFGVKAPIIAKKYLAQQIRFEKDPIHPDAFADNIAEIFADSMADIKARYPTTNMSKYFDRSPFVGATSLPLSFDYSSNENKRYDYVVLGGKKVRLTRKMIAQLAALNPFCGKSVVLDPRIIVTDKPTDITSWIKYNRCSSYKMAIGKASEYLQKQWQNRAVYDVLIKFNHPNYDSYVSNFRVKLVQALFEYSNRNILTTQLAHFIAMCKDAQTELMEYETLKLTQTDPTVQPDNVWFVKSERARDPKVVQKFVDGCLEKYMPKETPETALKNIINLYNNYGQYEQSVSGVEFVPVQEQYGVYQGFTEWMQYKLNGVYRNTPVCDIPPFNFKTQFNLYIFQKLRERMRLHQVGDESRLYMFQCEDTTQDYNHYKKFNKDKLAGLIKQYYTYLIQDYTKQSNSYVQDGGDDGTASSAQNSAKTSPTQFAFMVENIQYGISANDYAACVSNIIGEMRNVTTAPDQEINVIGVYNGVLVFHPEMSPPRLQLLQGAKAAEHFVTQSTMFAIDPAMCDEDGYLPDINEYVSDPENFDQPVVQAYNYNMSKFKDVFNVMAGNQIEIFEWKQYQVAYRMFSKNTVAQFLFVGFGTGGDGKTITAQPIAEAINASNENGHLTDSRSGIQRSITGPGHASIAKTAVLATSQLNTAQNDSCGLSEFCGKYYAVLPELPTVVPISMSAVKQMLSGTNITSRQIMQKEIKSFQSCVFPEAQFNYIPWFDGPVDKGLQRRILFYPFGKKFMELKDYEKIVDVDKEKKYCLKDATVFNKMTKTFVHIDAIGLMLLGTFMQRFQDPIKSDIEYVPELLWTYTQEFFASKLQHYKAFVSQFETTNDPTHFIVYSNLIADLKRFLHANCDEDDKKSVTKALVQDYEYMIKEAYINQLYRVEKSTGNQVRVEFNTMHQYQTSDLFTIVLQGVRYIDVKDFRRQQKIAVQYKLVAPAVQPQYEEDTIYDAFGEPVM